MKATTDLIRPLAVAATLLTAVGCSHMYNGGMAIKTEDRQQIEAYQRMQAERERQLAASRSGEAIATEDAVEADSTYKIDEGTATPPTQGMTPAATTAAVSEPTATPTSHNAIPDTTRRSMGSMGLFGQLPTSNTAGKSSAMDGIDNLSRVTVTSEGADFDPDLSPDGTWMVYASTRHRETADLYMKRVGGNAITQLSDDPSNDVMPVISPDGKRVAFASDRAGNWDIYLMEVTGGKSVKLTNSPTHDIHPTFSPDGKKLAYCSYGAPSGQWEIVVIDLDQPAVKKFVGFGLFPVWSPNEDKILYQRARQRGTRWFSVWSIDLDANGDSGAPTEIAASANAACITPDWSPDGQNIVFCTVIDPGADDMSRPENADLWVMNADGSNRARLTGGQFANLQPAWAADGSIFFVSDRGPEGIENVWAMRADQVISLAGNLSRNGVTATAEVPTTTE